MLLFGERRYDQRKRDPSGHFVALRITLLIAWSFYFGAGGDFLGEGAQHGLAFGT